MYVSTSVHADQMVTAQLELPLSHVSAGSMLNLTSLFKVMNFSS